jgi:hypothetical protein
MLDLGIDIEHHEFKPSSAPDPIGEELVDAIGLRKAPMIISCCSIPRGHLARFNHLQRSHEFSGISENREPR